MVLKLSKGIKEVQVSEFYQYQKNRTKNRRNRRRFDTIKNENAKQNLRKPYKRSNKVEWSDEEDE